MIPHTLTLKNFLSYANTPQTISFEGHSLICLSGKNGHGKSALLDAITWALWGQARKTTGTSKPDEGLVRLGADNMVVVFELWSMQKLYRVRREFTKSKGKAATALDFGVFDEERNEYQSLTDKTIKATQAKIEATIGLDFATYTNSAFLRQGNANEFSRKSPKERKKILASILGVNRYDALQTKALEKVRSLAQEKKILQSLQEQDATVISYKEEVSSSLKERAHDLQACDEKLDSLSKQQRKHHQAYEQHKARHAELLSRKNESNERLARVEKGITLWGEKTRAWRKDAVALRSIPEAGTLDAQIGVLKQKDKEMVAARDKQFALREEGVRLLEQKKERHALLSDAYKQKEETLVAKKTRSEMQEESSAREVAQLKALYHEHEKQCADIQVWLSEHKEKCELVRRKEQAHQADKKCFERRKAFYNTYRPQRALLEKECADLSEKHEVLSRSSAQGCPTCDQILSAQRKKRLCTTIQGKRTALLHRLSRIHTVLSKLKEVLVAQHAQLEETGKCVALLANMQAERAQKEQALAEKTKEKEELRLRLKKAVHAHTSFTAAHEHDKKECAVHAEQQQHLLRTDAQIMQLEKSYNDIRVAYIACVYDKEQHAQVQKEREEKEHLKVQLLHYVEKKAEHALQKKVLHQEKIRLQQEKHAAEQAIKKLQTEHVSDNEQALASACKEVDVAYAQQLEEKHLLLTEKGKLENRMALILEREKVHAQRIKDIDTIDNESDDYTVLATAWSKNGIQALLIEQAIPEIEQEANALLAQLSNNQAQVFIESQRDLKSGGVRETLDVKISDTSGVRPYEMYSGGEAFRIDFSLRIAISKLLARRAGASLQVLIIDEGFGSQDEEGLSRLMQALYAIQDDFEKIIIVSHLESFKDNFPTHFVVKKGVTGSSVTIESRG